MKQTAMQSLNEYRLLGNSGLRVSPLCLGAMTFGEAWGFGSGTEENRKIFDTYVEAGGNFIDTANIYQNGQSEKLLGEYMSSYRSQLVIATKYTLNPARMMTGDALQLRGTGKLMNGANLGGNSRKSLVENLDASLKRMGTGYVDVMYVHFWEYRTPMQEMMRALDDAVRSGKVLYVAISDTPAWVLSSANMMANLKGWSPFIGLQTRYNLLERSFEFDLQPACAEFGVGVVPWGCVAEGFLTGKYTKGQTVEGGRASTVSEHAAKEKNWEILGAVQDIAKSLNRSPVQVALNWTMQKAGITSPLVGCRTLAQLQENLKALEFRLTPEQMERLDTVSRPEKDTIPFPQRFGAQGLGFTLKEGERVEMPKKFHPHLNLTLGDQKDQHLLETVN